MCAAHRYIHFRRRRVFLIVRRENRIGTILCWGATGAPTPPTGTFASISAGSFGVCGLGTDGTITCWGGVATNGDSTPPSGRSPLWWWVITPRAAWKRTAP